MMHESDQERNELRSTNERKHALRRLWKIPLLGLVELWFPRLAFSTVSPSTRKFILASQWLFGVALAGIAVFHGKLFSATVLFVGFSAMTLLLALYACRIEARTECRARNARERR